MGPLASANTTTATRPEPATLQGGVSVTLASGSDAAIRTIATITVRTAQPGRPSSAASAGGAPSDDTAPATSARVPAAMAGGTSGTTKRLTAGASNASRPKASRTTGRVAASAANDTPRLSASQPGSTPPRHRCNRSVSGVP